MVKKIDFNGLIDFNVQPTDNPFTCYLGYFEFDKILGYIEYNVLYDTIDIVNVFVKEEFRNKGIGSALLKELIDLAKNMSLKNITLEVNVLNDAAIKLYKKFNFTVVSIRRGYYKGIDGYLMELIL